MLPSTTGIDSQSAAAWSFNLKAIMSARRQMVSFNCVSAVLHNLPSLKKLLLNLSVTPDVCLLTDKMI